MTTPNHSGKLTPSPDQKPEIPKQYSFLWFSAAIFLAFMWLQDSGTPKLQELAYSEFKTAVVNNQISEVTLKEENITGVFSDQGRAALSSGDRKSVV